MVRAQDPACLLAALDYLAREWQPIPLCCPDHGQCGGKHRDECKKPGKVPMMPSWQKKKLTEAELRGWWKRMPKANVGCVMGPASGLVGIDVDHGGTELWQSWGGGPFVGGPETLQFRTPHGIRLLYALPEGASVPTRSFKNGDGGEAIKVLSTGSQTVMPPSKLIEVKGKTTRELPYEWLPGFAPTDREPELMPDWLIAALGDDQGGRPGGGEPLSSQETPLAERAKAYLRECDPAVSGSGGHNQTYKVACRLIHGFGLRPLQAFELMACHYNDRCEPPWTQKELMHKVTEAAEKGSSPDLASVPRRIDQDPAPAIAKAPTAVTTFTADDLLREQLPPLRWVVPGLFPEGGLLLAGRPKGGKSWLALQAALAITEGIPVLGKIACPKAEALYLSLEDGKRRLQSRLRTLCGESLSPKGLHLGVAWPTLRNGCIDHLELWLDRHPAVKLVILDTLTRIRDRDNGRHKGNNYELDYDAIAPFSSLGQRRGICVELVHHTRKPKEADDDDPFDTISGTLGLAGATDTMAVLKRPIHSQEGQLFVRGRDVEDQTLQLLWNPETFLWTLHVETGLTPEYQRVVEALERFGKPVPVQAVATALGKTYEAAKKLLQRMKAQGLIRFGSKGYSAWDHVPDVPLDASPES